MDLFAQEKQVSGTVISEVDGLGLPGVTVMIKGTSTGTITDIDGEYLLNNVKPEDYLVFSFYWF